MPVAKTLQNVTTQLRSVNVGDIDIYETWIKNLEPGKMINDNIVHMLLRCLSYHQANLIKLLIKLNVRICCFIAGVSKVAKSHL